MQLKYGITKKNGRTYCTVILKMLNTSVIKFSIKEKYFFFKIQISYFIHTTFMHSFISHFTDKTMINKISPLCSMSISWRFIIKLLTLHFR